MNDDMNDLAPALLMAFVIAIGFVAYEFRSVYLTQPAHAVEAKIEKPKSDTAHPQLAMNDRLYWIR